MPYPIPRPTPWWKQDEALKLLKKTDLSVSVPMIRDGDRAYADPNLIDATRVTYSVVWSPGVTIADSIEVDVEVVAVVEAEYSTSGQPLEIFRTSYSLLLTKAAPVRRTTDYWEIPFGSVRFSPDLFVKIVVTADPRNKIVERSEHNNTATVYGLLLG